MEMNEMYLDHQIITNTNYMKTIFITFIMKLGKYSNIKLKAWNNLKKLLINYGELI